MSSDADRRGPPRWRGRRAARGALPRPRPLGGRARLPVALLLGYFGGRLIGGWLGNATARRHDRGAGRDRGRLLQPVQDGVPSGAARGAAGAAPARAPGAVRRPGRGVPDPGRPERRLGDPASEADDDVDEDIDLETRRWTGSTTTRRRIDVRRPATPPGPAGALRPGCARPRFAGVAAATDPARVLRRLEWLAGVYGVAGAAFLGARTAVRRGGGRLDSGGSGQYRCVPRPAEADWSACGRKILNNEDPLDRRSRRLVWLRFSLLTLAPLALTLDGLGARAGTGDGLLGASAGGRDRRTVAGRVRADRTRSSWRLKAPPPNTIPSSTVRSTGCGRARGLAESTRIPAVPDHVVMALLVLVLVAVVFIPLRSKLKSQAALERPGKGQQLLELVVLALRNLMEDVIGHGAAKRFMPMIGALAFFIFLCNILGPVLLPAAADRQHQHHLRALDHRLALLPPGRDQEARPRPTSSSSWDRSRRCFFLFIPLELISHLARAFSLGLRLFGNIFGEHLAASVFFMIPFIVPFPMMALGIFGATLQAFIFCMLTMVYIAGAEADEH